MNLEVTVGGQRGWVNETAHESTESGNVLAADMKVHGKLLLTELLSSWL